MALFSRRGSSSQPEDSAPSAEEVAPEVIEDPSVSDGSAEAPSEEPAEAVPHVAISLSTFGQAPVKEPALSSPQSRPTAAVPPPSETIPGLADNVLLQAMLAALPEKPQSADILNVMRQTLQGQLYVRAQGDAQSLLAEGKGLNLAITTFQDKQFLLVFSGGAALQRSTLAEGEGVAASAVGQTAANVLRTAVTSGYAGVYLDHANEGARLVLPIELIQKSLDEGAEPFELKNLLSRERTDSTTAEAAEIMTRTRVWVAGNENSDGQIGLAEARSTSGARRLEIYSHPLEVIAMGRGDRPLPLEPDQLARTLASEEGLDGIVIDAAGPWLELDRTALAPVIALAS